jgi:transcriptional regulator with XRE-family HTH domain
MSKVKKVPVARRRPAAKPSVGGGLEVGGMIRRAREGAHISQEELAVRLSTKRTAISRIENHAEDIKLSTLDRVAKALGKELKVKIG